MRYLGKHFFQLCRKWANPWGRAKSPTATRRPRVEQLEERVVPDAGTALLGMGTAGLPVDANTTQVVRQNHDAPDLDFSVAALETAQADAVQGGLVASFSFEEGSGRLAHDGSGNGHNGIISGAARGAGKVGQGLSFDGRNDYVGLGKLDVTDDGAASQGITLAAWINARQFDHLYRHDARILSKASAVWVRNHYWTLSTIRVGGETRLQFALKTGTGMLSGTTTLTASSGNLNENTWYHVVATYDGQSMRLYLDGQEVGSTGKTGLVATNDQVAAWIGGNPNSRASRPWNGWIDEVHIYNQALSPEAIQALMNGTKPLAASAGADQVTEEGSQVQLTGGATGGAPGYSYIWDFGDGSTATGQTVYHPFQDDGIYDITLTVSDSAGATSSDSLTVTVNNVAPTATLSADGPVVAGNPATVSFLQPSDPSAADTAAGFTYSYDLDNDGSFELSQVSNASATHTFNAAGNHTVRGRIHDKDGASSEYTTVVEVVSDTPTSPTYHVSPTGSDGGNGSSAQPWRTLQHAADTVKAGDTVLVQAGTYAGFDLRTDGTADAPITFRAEAGVVINAANPRTSDGINLEGADYVVIDGFTVTGVARAGIRSVLNHHVTIRNNTTDQNGVWGIFTGFSDDLLIENNVTSRSGREHGIYVSNSGDRPVIRGNTIWGNNANGIHMNGDLSQGGDGIISGALVEGNVIYDNGRGGGSGINADGVQGSVFRNNVLYNNHASGISLYRIDGGGPSANNFVINNTIVMASDARWALNIQDGSTGNTAYNNILYNHHSFRGSINISADSLPGFVSDYNVVMSRFTTNDGNSILTLSQWQASTGQDTHSIIATPSQLFVNPSANDYHLSSTSPALDQGTSLQAPGIDFEEDARPGGPAVDIGADEYHDDTP